MEHKFKRDEYLFLARMAQQTERYNEMIEFIGIYVTQP